MANSEIEERIERLERLVYMLAMSELYAKERWVTRPAHPRDDAAALEGDVRARESALEDDDRPIG